MKKIIIAAIALTWLYACDNSNKNASSFEITGNLTNTKGESIYLEKLGQQGANVIDSAIIGEKGDFKMNHYSPSVGFYRLRISASNFAMLVLDSAQKVMITGDARDLGNTYKAEGSPDTKLYLEYNTLAQGQKHRTDSLGNIINDSVILFIGPRNPRLLSPIPCILTLGIKLIIKRLYVFRSVLQHFFFNFFCHS